MCEIVRYYDRWVNGAGMRVVEMAAGRLPSAAPAAAREAAAQSAACVKLDLCAADATRVPLPTLDAQALAPVKHVLLHGSMATDDACEFSDVDIAVFVDDLAPFTPDEHRRAVHELRHLLHAALAFDPLMHHGLMFAPAGSLRAYDQRFLPVDTLANARVLHGPGRIDVHTAPAPASVFARSLENSAVSIRRHLETRDFLADDYRLKNFLSGVLLLPARILAARGTFVYKRESFDLARPLFKPAEWEFIARCEALRALWKRPPAPLPQRIVSESLHPQLRGVIGRRMPPRLNVRRLSSAMVDGLLASARRFFEHLESAA